MSGSFVHLASKTPYLDALSLPKIFINGQELCELTPEAKLAAGFAPAVIDPVPAYDLISQFVTMNDQVTDQGDYYRIGHTVHDKTPGVLWQEKLARLQMIKDEKLARINEVRNCKEKNTPFMFKPAASESDLAFDYDQDARDRLNPAIAVAQTMAINGVAVTTIVTPWTLADNSSVDMTVADFLAFSIAQATRSGSIHARAKELKAQVEAILFDDRPEPEIANEINLIPVE